MSSLMVLAQKLFDFCYDQTVKEYPAPVTGVDFVGHRGLMGHPQILENTHEAFAYAVQQGAAVELDVRLSKDSVPMVHHDKNTQRVFGLPFGIASLSREEWRQVLPELPCLSELIPSLPQCPHWYIEIKDLGDSDSNRLLISQTLDVLLTYGIQSKTTFLALDASLLALIKEIAPQIPRAFVYLLSPKLGLEYIQQDPDALLLGWHLSFPARLKTRICMGRNIVGAGFANYPSTARQLMHKGFNLIFSDRLDRLKEAPRGQ